MNVDLSYLGRSEVVEDGRTARIGLVPNLARGRVAFDGAVRDPVRYREAMSALHAIVVSDLRFKPRDKSAYEAHKQRLQEEEDSVRRGAAAQARTEAPALPPGVEPRLLAVQFGLQHAKYWRQRRAWANDLARTDPALFRSLVPCDPVITVASDIVYFEGFSKDESSYGCLSVDRDAFDGTPDIERGTTNVDYSMALFDQIQRLRSYRSTRLRVDPHGFDVAVAGHEDHREEKIDLPPSWLRGFGQIQAASSLGGRRVALDVGAVHGLLTWLQLHRERVSPRAIRFELRNGAPVQLVLEPWEQRIVTRTVWRGPDEDVRIWGRRRLASLARVLPLADSVDVRLLGTGLPSLWTVKLGAMRLTLGLSGWTTNDWTSGLALDLLAGGTTPRAEAVAAVGEALVRLERADAATIGRETHLSPADARAALVALARAGQSIYDASEDVYRFRSVLPVALSEDLLGPPHPEAMGARALLAGRRVVLERVERAGAFTVRVGKVEEKRVEVATDGDGILKKAQCPCSWSFKYGLRRGPCRHVLALHLLYRESPAANSGGARWN